MKSMNNISDEKIQDVVCEIMKFHISTFSKEFINKKYIYPVYPKHIFVTEVLNMLGMPVDKANEISKENTVSFHGREIWSNQELIDFVKNELVPRLNQ